MVRHGKKFAWFALVAALLSAWWAFDVEITYERNVRHIPTDFRIRHRPGTERRRA